jgi:hypothetical protein
MLNLIDIYMFFDRSLAPGGISTSCNKIGNFQMSQKIYFIACLTKNLQRNGKCPEIAQRIVFMEATAEPVKKYIYQFSNDKINSRWQL